MAAGGRASWSGQLAFILAAAASAIGLGNLWRFPYLAAQYGGGTFICLYILLALTLGFTLMATEIAIGRKTAQSQLTAYSLLSRRWGFLGVLGTIVPIVITSYYSVIGGWVLRYLVAYGRQILHPGETVIANAAGAFDAEAFFRNFIGASDGFAAAQPFLYMLVFMLMTAGVILLGVKNGIEKSNLVMMPLLFLMAIGIAVYGLFLPGATEGLSYCLVPNLDALRGADGAFSCVRLAQTVLGAMGQMFYSLSLAMGIMITYGSYMKKSDSIERSVWNIEFFDAAISIVAAVMIIPVVYVFAVKTGTPVKEAMNAGPGLMFVTLPKVFGGFGAAAPYVGFAFFLLVTFAALTSCISLFEACVAACCDLLKVRRRVAVFGMLAVEVALGTLSAFGYGAWKNVRVCGQQFLDFFDFATNSVLMPTLAAATCVFVGWVLKPRAVVDEVCACGQKFRLRGLYVFMVRYFAPILVAAILVSEICRFFGDYTGWKI